MTEDKAHFEMRRIGPEDVTSKLVLDSYYSAFRNTLKLLRQINNTLPQLAATDLAAAKANLSRRVEQLDPDGKKQYGKYEEYSKNRRKRKVEIKHEEAAKLRHENMDLFLFSLRIPQFIREMSLVYLVASFESYLADTLKLAFSTRKDILRPSQKNITHGEVISYSDFDSLLNAIIEDEVKELLYGDIDDIIKTLRNRFFNTLNLEKKDAEWQQFKEYWYRRNIVIHNYGKRNAIYNMKTKSNKDLNNRLLVEQDYLSEGFELFENYAGMLYSYFLNVVKQK